MSRVLSTLSLGVLVVIAGSLPPASANPLDGYAGFTSFYTLPYANTPGFGQNNAPSDPQIRLSFSGSTLDINLDPTSVSWFAPLPGNFSENQPPLQDQFFNTGRNVINAFDFLYDGLNGYAGLRPNGLAIPSANVQFTAGYYPNPVPEPNASMLLLMSAAGLMIGWRGSTWRLTRRNGKARPKPV